LPDKREVYEPYSETWIFEKMNNSWFPVRIHYSKNIQEEHSEEVNQEELSEETGDKSVLFATNRYAVKLGASENYQDRLFADKK